jgi:hypothetical protein
VASTINARAGDILRIPLYDDMACDAGGPGGGASYNISTVGCIQVVEWDKLKRDDTSDPNRLEQQGIFPVGTYPDINANSERVIWAKALPNIACMTACGSTDGSQPIPGQLTAVSLIE